MMDPNVLVTTLLGSGPVGLIAAFMAYLWFRERERNDQLNQRITEAQNARITEAREDVHTIATKLAESTTAMRTSEIAMQGLQRVVELAMQRTGT